MNTETKTESTVDPLTKYKMKYRALFFGAYSIVLLALAFIISTIDYSILNLPTVITRNGIVISDTKTFAVLLIAISILFSFIGMFYSLINKRILAFLLSSIVIGGFTYAIFINDIFSVNLSKFKIEQRVDVKVKTSVISKSLKEDINETVKSIKEVEAKEKNIELNASTSIKNKIKDTGVTLVSETNQTNE